MSEMPLVSALIINWNTRALLVEAIDSIYATAPAVPLEIIVVDNASSDGSCEYLAAHYHSVQLIRNTENVGFARANNQAARAAGGKYLLLLNSDACMLPGALSAMINLAESNPNLSAVGPQLRNPDGSFQFSYADFPTLGREFLVLSTLGRRIFGSHYPSHPEEEAQGPKKVDYVNGACMLIPREVYLQVGGLPEQYFMYAEEVDFCYSIQNGGGEVWYHPGARVMHHGSASSQNRLPAREGDMYQSRVRFIRKSRGNLSAGLLKALIFCLTAAKIIWHGFLRKVSRGKSGRPVISLPDLRARLREV